MAEFEYGRIQRLAESLTKRGVADEVATEILTGGAEIRKNAKPEVKAKWFQLAMERMDDLLDAETRQAVREGCACCLGGKRLQLSKSIAREHATLGERIVAANATPFVFGHSVTLQPDGRIRVSFFPEGHEQYHCVCLTKAKEPVSVTYCYCCAGHVKHHLQIALDRKLSATVHSSALSSGGTEPCTFLFRIEDTEQK